MAPIRSSLDRTPPKSHEFAVEFSLSRAVSPSNFPFVVRVPKILSRTVSSKAPALPTTARSCIKSTLLNGIGRNPLLACRPTVVGTGSGTTLMPGVESLHHCADGLLPLSATATILQQFLTSRVSRSELPALAVAPGAAPAPEFQISLRFSPQTEA